MFFTYDSHKTVLKLFLKRLNPPKPPFGGLSSKREVVHTSTFYGSWDISVTDFPHQASIPKNDVLYVIALASATGEKNFRPPCQGPTKPPLPRPRRGRRPRRRPVTGGGGRRPPTTRPNKRPSRKKFSTKVEKLASAIIHDYVKLKTRLSRKPLSRLVRNLKLCSFCLEYVSTWTWKFQVFIF